MNENNAELEAPAVGAGVVIGTMSVIAIGAVIYIGRQVKKAAWTGTTREAEKLGKKTN